MQIQYRVTGAFIYNNLHIVVNIVLIKKTGVDLFIERQGVKFVLLLTKLTSIYTYQNNRLVSEHSPEKKCKIHHCKTGKDNNCINKCNWSHFLKNKSRNNFKNFLSLQVFVQITAKRSRARTHRGIFATCLFNNMKPTLSLR